MGTKDLIISIEIGLIFFCLSLALLFISLMYLISIIREKNSPIQSAELFDLLNRIRPLVNDASVTTGYGLHRPDNPHDFEPEDLDEFCSENTPEQIAAWKADCDAYDRDEYKPAQPSDEEFNMELLISGRWGMGTYKMRDEEMCALLEEIDAIIAKVSA